MVAGLHKRGKSLVQVRRGVDVGARLLVATNAEGLWPLVATPTTMRQKQCSIKRNNDFKTSGRTAEKVSGCARLRGNGWANTR